MSQKPLVPESHSVIRFSDCDPFNHLNNSRYLDYFMNAREDHLKDYYDFDIYGHSAETGKSWVVAQNQIVYLSPALLMEKVLIQSTLLEWNSSDVLVEMRMWKEDKSRLKSVLWARFAHFDLRTQKRAEHDEALVERFKSLLNPLPEKTIFEQRVSLLRGKKFDEI